MTVGEMLLEMREDFCVDDTLSVIAAERRLGVPLRQHLGPLFEASPRGQRMRRVLAIERAAVEHLRLEGKLR